MSEETVNPSPEADEAAYNEHLGFIRHVEAELSLPDKFVTDLMGEDDWSFVIKLHALIEAATSRLLTEQLGKPELADLFSRLELSNLTTGKLAFARNLNLIDRDTLRFVQKLSEVRNSFVHDVANVTSTLSGFFDGLDESEKKGLRKAFGWGYTRPEDVPVRVDEEHFHKQMLLKQFAVVTLDISYKVAIWFGALVVLWQLQEGITAGRLERQLNELEEQLEPLAIYLRSRGINVTGFDFSDGENGEEVT